jgi:sporulation protein YlmC with PRC-barrel domain
MRNALLMSTAAALLAAPAWAQTEQQATPEAEQQVAQQCLDDLRLLSQQMAEEGYWFSGYRAGWGWRGYAGGMADQAMPPADPAAAPADPALDPAVDPAAADAAMEPGMAAGPWGDTGWSVSPGHQIQTLQSAAAVLARQGDEEGCQYLLARLHTTYDDFAGQLREAGVEPGQVSAWREEQIAAAVPVNELEQVVSIDSVLGTEVRNHADENLGSVADVVMDPESGDIAFVIISHGGFLGFGEDYAAVPWTMLRATPGFETFLLDVSQEALENAPQVDPDQLAGREGFTGAREELTGYWQQQGG